MWSLTILFLSLRQIAGKSKNAPSTSVYLKNTG